MPLVVFNQKGGVGKSTITCNLAAISASQGLRTLVIDLDPQGNSSSYLLGAQESDELPSVAGFFEHALSYSFKPVPPTEFIVPTPHAGLHLMPSSSALNELQGKLESRQKIYKLREGLQQLARDFDRIYIDTPPALNFFTRSALIGASGCLIPFDCDEFARKALYALLDNVQEIRADHNASILLCTHDMDEAEELCDRIGIIVNGKIVAMSTANGLKHQFRQDLELPSLEDVFMTVTGTSLAEAANVARTMPQRSSPQVDGYAISSTSSRSCTPAPCRADHTIPWSTASRSHTVLPTGIDASSMQSRGGISSPAAPRPNTRRPLSTTANADPTHSLGPSNAPPVATTEISVQPRCTAA